MNQHTPHDGQDPTAGGDDRPADGAGTSGPLPGDTAELRPGEPVPPYEPGPPNQPGPPNEPGPPFLATPPPAGAPPQNFFDWIRSQGLYRGRERWIGGVASGIAQRLGVDPLIVRGILIVLTVFAGVGVLLYGLAWALLPEPDGRIHVQEAAAGRWTSGMTGALITTIIGLPSLGTGVWGWDRYGFGGFIWTVFWVGGTIYLVYYLTQRNRNRNGPPQINAASFPAPGPTGTTPGTTAYGAPSYRAASYGAASYRAASFGAAASGPGTLPPLRLQAAAIFRYPRGPPRHRQRSGTPARALQRWRSPPASPSWRAAASRPSTPPT